MLHFEADVKSWCNDAFLGARILHLIQAGWTHSVTDPSKWTVGNCSLRELVMFMRAPDGVLCKLELSNFKDAYRTLVGAEFDYWWRAST